MPILRTARNLDNVSAASVLKNVSPSVIQGRWPAQTPHVSAVDGAISTSELIAQRRSTRVAVVSALNQLLDLKDLSLGTRSMRLAEWGVQAGRQLGLDSSSLQDLEVAALLHDIGKIGIPDMILGKPGALTEVERDQMRKHPEYSWAVLRTIPGFERASLFALHYHEAYDGDSFVRLFGSGNLPQIQHSLYTNNCDIGFQLGPDGKRIIVVSCIDNLMKGAAGQAVQNMNLMCGFGEDEGLR